MSERVKFSLRIPVEKHLLLAQIAKEKGTSINDEIISMIDKNTPNNQDGLLEKIEQLREETNEKLDVVLKHLKGDKE